MALKGYKSVLKIGFVLALSTIISFSGINRVKAANPEKTVQEILAKMTLEQKAHLIIGTGMSNDLPDSIMKKLGLSGNGAGEKYSQMVARIKKYLPGAAGFTSEYPEIGITSQALSDGPAGLRIQPKRQGEEKTYYCTAFPIATVLASTWDTELVYKVGQAMGSEVKEYGSDILLAPALNIQRDPLCGRNFEYYSEDPLIAGKMAAAMVNGVESNQVGTSIKHFAANNSETNRISVNTIVSQRALREIYLRGFEIAVKEAQPWTVMSSYNKINGVYTSESHDLITNILRNDWGFKGYVMTDWGGGSDVVAQMNAGNDMIQPGQAKQFQDLVTAIKNGKLDQKVVDRNVARILTIMLETPRYKKYPFSSTPNLKANAEVTRQVASDGMVLLKNGDKDLPFSKTIKNIAAFGNTSYDFISGGTGSGDVNEAYTISLTDGLINGGYTIIDQLKTVYDQYRKEAESKKAPSTNQMSFMRGKEPLPEMAVSPELAKQMAEKADVALITIGRNAGEGRDRQVVEGDFLLSSVEKELIKNVSEAFKAKGKKTIVILNIAGVIETASWRDIPDAILLAWQPGQEAGNSVTDVLSGKVNPSGKLAATFPMSYSDTPTAKNFPGVAEKSNTTDNAADLSGVSRNRRTNWKIIYEEDVYVGYRYYNTFKVPTAYEFGYGESYTTFGISKLKLSTKNFKNEITASVDVKNTGDVAGREVAQVYLSAPAQKMGKPVEVLVAFGKTKLLKPGEKQTLSFTLNPRDLASFDESTSSWIAEAGNYEVRVGNSSVNIEQKASFNLKNELVVEKVSHALAPPEEINKLTKK
jgi:beta-glucosidase